MRETGFFLQILGIFELDDLDLESEGKYLVADIGQEGTYGQSEGVLLFVAEPHTEDVPGSGIGDDLVLDTFRVVCLVPILWLHE